MHFDARMSGRGSDARCGRPPHVAGIFVVLALLFWGGAGGALARSPGDPPIYNPGTKSYFQILETTGRHGNWPESLDQARAQVFKGVRGRLAVIDSPETHEFVMRNFDMSNPTWIGLRYWCEFRMLEWVGLRPYSPSDPGRYQAWHPQWSRVDPPCPPNARGPDAFLPVYYQPISDSSALWQASRVGKGFGVLLVEYPTGGE